MKYLFGPVNSRRLGISLGVDLVPYKTCSLNCVYCECGETDRLTAEIREYVPSSEVIDELERYLSRKPALDVITFAGSGEPTLHSGIGGILDFIKDNYPAYRVVVLTNGTLLYRDDVRKSLLRADTIIPSLDAAGDAAFTAINRPAPGITAQRLIDGLVRLREEFGGEILLEIFIVPGINDTPDELQRIKNACERILPNRIQLNTLDRPGTEARIKPATPNRMKEIGEFFSTFPVDVVGAPRRHNEPAVAADAMNLQRIIIETLERRPSTLDDLRDSLGVGENDLRAVIDALVSENLVEVKSLERGDFYTIKK